MKTKILDYIGSTFWLTVEDIAKFASKATTKGAKVIVIPQNLTALHPNLEQIGSTIVVIVTGSYNIDNVLEALELFIEEDVTDIVDNEDYSDDTEENDDGEE